MSGLIDTVLDLREAASKLASPIDLRHNVPLALVVEQVVSELCLGVPDATIETDFDLPVSVRCDPSRIGQLVSNCSVTR